jgi:hypothetical protein
MPKLITAKYKEPRMARRLIALSFLILSTFVAIAGAARATDLGPVSRYLSDDVVGVASIDLAKLDLLAGFEAFVNLGVVPPEQVAAQRTTAAAAEQGYATLKQLGVTRAYALLRTSDLQYGGASWVIELRADADATKAASLLKSWVEKAISERSFGDETSILPQKFEAVGAVVLGASSDEQLALLKKAEATAIRPDAAAALDALLASDGGVIAFGDADSRRVLREMFPQLPQPFAAIDGKFIAEGVKWAGVMFKLPPTPTIGMTIETTSPDVALKLQEAANNGLTLLKGLAIGALASGQSDVAAALPALALLKPEVDGSKISMTLGDDPGDAAAFRSFLAPAVGASREAAWRTERMNDFKHIALGMLMYHDAKGAYPAAASHSADGKPLLSWRVLILPFIEEGELYKQFRLDEPWDSEHNRTLIAKMPAVYADPGAPDLSAAGRTTYLVPVGAGMLFHGAEGTKIRDITDGTSQTILAVEVAPDQAVEWTKPADWEVDLNDPTRGLKRADGDSHGGTFAAAYCDGHIETMSIELSPDVLKARLTMAGGEATQ